MKAQAGAQLERCGFEVARHLETLGELRRDIHLRVEIEEPVIEAQSRFVAARISGEGAMCRIERQNDRALAEGERAPCGSRWHHLPQPRAQHGPTVGASDS